MGVSKEVFVDLQEKFEKVKKLIEEDSKTDPPDEPYKSKYAAKNLLIGMRNSIERLRDSSIPESKVLVESMLGTVWLHLGIISIDTEELSNGESHLNSSLAIVEHDPTEPYFVSISLNALNHLGILWSNRDDAEKSRHYLERSLKLYTEFAGTKQVPYGFVDVFRASGERDGDEARRSLEKTHTLTLYYLAQIYGSLKDALKSAVYCHVTLKRQLEYDDYEPIDWSLNAATLSQFLMEQNGFKQARHHLAAASYMLGAYEDGLNATVESEDEHEAKKEVFKHRTADVARCWAKYGLLLLSTSKDRLMNHVDDEAMTCELSSDLAKLELAPGSTVSSDDLKNLRFPTLKLDVYERQITDQFVLTFEDARAVFLNTQTWLNEAEKYYTLENHASDYVQIVQDTSQLYNLLAFYEDDPERQSKMHKRRIDHLEKVLGELNPTYYIQVCRQIWYELGEIYDTNLDIKMDKLKTTKDRPRPHALAKINTLIEKSIENFTRFLDSLKLPATNQLPDDIHEDYEKPAVKAYFHVGVLYGKFLNPDRNVQLENTEKSLEYFNKMIDYCARHEKIEEYCRAELSACKEMVQLLPYKIQKLTNEIVNNVV